MPSSPPTLNSIFSTILPNTSLAHPPLKPHFPYLTAQIASLSLHPTLEALLHILNADLPSAHFLVRHMQAPPAVEGMLLHGILHRAEGDFNNARAWLGDVGDACEGFVPKRRERGERLSTEVAEGVKCGEGVRGKTLVEFVYGEEKVGKLVDDVEAFRGREKKEERGGEEEALEARIRAEAERVFEWCRAKFGAGEWVDAREAWVQNSEEVKKMSEDMVSGDKGFREF